MASRLPTGRLTRLARMARLGVSGAATAVTGRDPADLAAQAAEQLADLRGLAAKAGQLGSYLDAVLPKDAPPGVREALQRLNDATSTSPWDEVEDVIRADLPDVAEQILAAMDHGPVASGSIAQVHRATHPTRGAVAVKVQHPGVATVLRGELGQAGLLVKVAGAIMPGSADIFDEVRSRFEGELDQEGEAARTRAWAEAMADVDGIVVPEVVDDWTGPRVLTTTWVEGVDLDTAAATLPQDVRDRAADRLLTAFGVGLSKGLVHADPNAGNFRFQPDGTVAILDLGCVQPVPAPARGAVVDALRSAEDLSLARALGQPTDDAVAEPVGELMAGLLAPWRVVGRIDKEALHRIGAATPRYKAALAKHRANAGPVWAPLLLRTWIGLLAHVHHLGAVLDGPALRAALPTDA